MIDNMDNVTAKVSSGSGSVKVEPSRQSGSSITPGESRKESFQILTNHCLKILAAYEPAQALRDQIALLNAGRSQGACIPLRCPDIGLV